MPILLQRALTNLMLLAKCPVPEEKDGFIDQQIDANKRECWQRRCCGITSFHFQCKFHVWLSDLCYDSHFCLALVHPTLCWLAGNVNYSLVIVCLRIHGSANISTWYLILFTLDYIKTAACQRFKGVKMLPLSSESALKYFKMCEFQELIQRQIMSKCSPNYPPLTDVFNIIIIITIIIIIIIELLAQELRKESWCVKMQNFWDINRALANEWLNEKPMKQTVSLCNMSHFWRDSLSHQCSITMFKAPSTQHISVDPKLT